MCGVTGYFSYKNKIDTKKYYDAHNKIAHRGPDDEGFIYCDGDSQIKHLIGSDTIKELSYREQLLDQEPSNLILGHRRLSIIDLSAAGHQPFSFKNLYLVYNGEIYNYIELRDELKELGYSFETNSDTEVFLKAYHCWGVDAFNKLNGMWASAIYDKEQNTLLLTRDRFGIKPLYYSLVNDNLIFGSEIKFVASFMQKLYANEQMIYDYVEYGYISHTSDTFFKDITQLEAGCYAIYDDSKLLKKRFYFKSKKESKNSVEKIKKAFLNSVKLRMRSDVKVGALLSGGMDSSSIVCSIHKEEYSSDMETFTMSYAEKGLDYEALYVEDINQQTNFKNHSIFLKPDIKIVDELVYILEVPYRAFSEHAAYNIYEHIKNTSDIKVLLNGEGSDEIFSGYNADYSFYLLTLLTQLKISKFLTEFRAIKARTFQTRLSLLKKVGVAFIIHYNLRKFFKKNKFFLKNFRINRKLKTKNPLRNEMLNNKEYSALPEYLHYSDRLSMHFSLEVRVPFLDYRLVEIANSLNNDELIRNGVTKYTLREAVKEIVPSSVYERKDKQGFFTPFESWLQSSLLETVDKEINEIYHNGLFSFMNVHEINDYYKKNGADIKIWRIYCLSRWKKVWDVTE